MTGKPYTMREMRAIVDYLVEHKAYSEIRGRKMWMDYANSQLTTRTWQSLKETFLKRILPDLNNPYYKLSFAQINSFRQCKNLEDQDKNKLEIRTVTEDSSNNDKADTEKNGNKESDPVSQEADKAPGEEITANVSPRRRSSADTLILDDNFYNNAEEIQNDLENNEETDGPKHIKDCIKFEGSENFLPDVKKVLDDFATESDNSDKDTPMEVAENVEVIEIDNTENSSNFNDVAEEVIIENIEEINENSRSTEHLSEIEQFIQDVDAINHNAEDIPDSDNIPDPVNISAPKDASTKDTDKTEFVTAISNADSTEIPAGQVEKLTPNDHSVQATNQVTQNASHNSTDTLLPNNQEALNGDTNKTQNKTADKEKEIDKSETEANKSKEPEPANHKDDNNKQENNNKPKNKNKKRTHSQDSKSSGSSKKVKVNKGKQKKVAAPVVEEKTVENNNCSGEMLESNQVEVMETDNPGNQEAANNNEQNNATEQNEPTVQNEPPKNPCLQSVSLFEEQFNMAKFSSDSSANEEAALAKLTKDMEVRRSLKNCHLLKKMLNEDIVLLKSNSESEQEQTKKSPVKRKVEDKNVKKQREKALANAFGFSGGSRKRRISSKKMPKRHSYNVASESSEWTSESDSETYVSPPRGRKNRHSRKYLKPKSARILSLEEEGGLFVMHGNRIYPLVKDGKIIKNYVSYNPGSDSEEEDNSYWRQKYVEEKMRSNELKKQLECVTERVSTKGNKEMKSPNTYPRYSRKMSTHVQPIEKNIVVSDDSSVKEAIQTKREAPKSELREEKIKITFAKNNQEVQLEGHWPQIHPVIKEVVEIFQKEPEKDEQRKSRSSDSKSIEGAPIVSGQTTPIAPVVDPVIRAKVNEIENEIFKEIENRDKEEQIKGADDDTTEVNVTKRKGRPRKLSSSVASTTETTMTRRSSKSSVDFQNKTELRKSEVRSNPETKTSDIETRSSKRLSLTKKAASDAGSPVKKAMETRSKKSLDAAKDDKVRYMLPPNKEQKAANKSTGRRSIQQETIARERSSRSIDSTLGYQDSDFSPVITKRKRRYSFKTLHKKPKRTSLRSLPDLTHIYSSDSSNSSYFIPVKHSQSTLNSDVYKTESYQLLMPTKKVKGVRSLQCIQESPNNLDVRHFDYKQANKLNESNVIVEVCSSSNVSLPSPELSVVENLTISREMVKSNSDTLNEMQKDVSNKYFISDVDVTIPLMDQECELRKTVPDSTNKSLLKKIESVNLKEKSVSDDLDTKLRDLLLESAKKISNNTDNMDVDKENLMEVDPGPETIAKKTRSKKRCSTPRKKKAAKTIKVPDKSVIVEERMESCAYGGRTSCPPTITFTTDENENNCDDTNTTKVRGRKKKDIIRVKIQRPKSRSKEKISEKTDKNITRTSICTDSGINNDSSISGVLKVTDDSVELIHNHSETCLHANECINDSVEFVENSDAIVSINSSVSIDNELFKLMDDVERLSGDMCFNSDAQDVSAFERYSNADNASAPGTVYHSPVGSNDSLITEDLSDEPPSQPTSWYLLSEEDTNQTHQSFGSNLKQIFPITCAIPDLSTISEMSKENEDSRKPNLDTDN